MGILLALVGVYALGDAILAPAPISTSPGFLEIILASHAVVAAVRIAVIFAAGFIAASTVALASQRRWPTRIGPVQIDGDLSRLEEENEELTVSLASSKMIMDNLELEMFALREESESR